MALLIANKDLAVVEQQEYLDLFVLLASSLVVEMPNEVVFCVLLAMSLQPC